jgi:hypothetical protein
VGASFGGDVRTVRAGLRSDRKAEGTLSVRPQRVLEKHLHERVIPVPRRRCRPSPVRPPKCPQQLGRATSDRFREQAVGKESRAHVSMTAGAAPCDSGAESPGARLCTQETDALRGAQRMTWDTKWNGRRPRGARSVQIPEEEPPRHHTAPSRQWQRTPRQPVRLAGCHRNEGTRLALSHQETV